MNTEDMTETSPTSSNFPHAASKPLPESPTSPTDTADGTPNLQTSQILARTAFAFTAPPTPTSTAPTSRQAPPAESNEPPARSPPPPPPPAHSTTPTNPTTGMNRADSLRSRPGANGPMQRFYSETPVSSILHGSHHRDIEHPVSYMPPSPPLTRNSTTATRAGTTTAGSPLAAAPTTPTAPGTMVGSGAGSGSGSGAAGRDSGSLARQATNASSASASSKDARRASRALGSNPVDYLLPFGSLERPISPYFNPASDPYSLELPPGMDFNDPTKCPPSGLFGNLHTMLDSYLTILQAGGSIAVGTGYRSVARRLLDRVEGMFARDLGVDGVGWPDVLEYLRGKRTKPLLCVLPVRGLLSRGGDEGSVINAPRSPTARPPSPPRTQMGPISKVEKWLLQVEEQLKSEDQQAPSPPAPPVLTPAEEAAEDRVVVRIIEQILSTHTGQEQVETFHEYLSSSSLISNSRLALERLYPDHPADSITAPIVALYLLMHPDLHPLLAATASIEQDELDLLNSGRFDAFLDGSSKVVAQDEDEELAVISKLDKRLNCTLEALEDEIEELHNKALGVRRALKARREHISTQRKSRPHLAMPGESLLGSRSGSPAPLRSPSTTTRLSDGMEKQVGGLNRSASMMHQEPNEILPERPSETEEEWALNVPSLHIPIMPDDSASNIDFSRHRRRHERVSSSSGLERGSSRRSERGERERGESRISSSKRERKESRLGAREGGRREFSGTVLESIAGSEAGETTHSGKKYRKKKRDGSRVDGEDDEERRRRRKEREGREKEHGEKHRERREKEKEREREGKKEEKEKEKGKGQSWSLPGFAGIAGLAGMGGGMGGVKDEPAGVGERPKSSEGKK